MIEACAWPRVCTCSKHQPSFFLASSLEDLSNQDRCFQEVGVSKMALSSWTAERTINYVRVTFGQLDCVSSLPPLYSWVIVMYSSRLPVPVIGDKAHQPSLFEATATFLPIFTNSAARPSGSHMATVDRARDRWLQIVWKWQFLLFKAQRRHDSQSW